MVMSHVLKMRPLMPAANDGVRSNCLLKALLNWSVPEHAESMHDQRYGHQRNPHAISSMEVT